MFYNCYSQNWIMGKNEWKMLKDEVIITMVELWGQTLNSCRWNERLFFYV